MKTIALIFLAGIFSSTMALAATRDEWKDEDGDGRKEAHFFYEDGKLIKTEADADGDGVMDNFIEYENGKRRKGSQDKDNDGKIERWVVYNTKEKLIWRATDSNKDGKPDRYSFFPQATRDSAIKEYDLNFDGKIDKRAFIEWDGDKKIMVPQGNRMTYIPNPGYRNLWREEDSNFDGVIDLFSSRDKKAKTRVGEKIDPSETAPEKAMVSEKPSEPAKPKSLSQIEAERVKRLNDQYMTD